MRDIKIGRRQFVQSSLMASMLPISSRAASKEQSFADVHPARLHKLLVDRSIPESVRLGAYASAIADEVVEFDGDLTRLWNEKLRLEWQNGPQPIAGLTTPGVRLVLEQLGRDHDARIVFSAEHQRVGNHLQHSLTGCESILNSPRVRSGADWIGNMARHIAACPHDTSLRPASFVYETALETEHPVSQQQLVTWILAPVTRFDAPNSSETVSYE